MTTDYSIFYKNELCIDKDPDWEKEYDIFLSGFNKSERVRKVFNKINSPTKVWLVFPEYNFIEADLPEDEDYHICTSSSESRQILDAFKSLNKDLSEETSIAIDITGFLRPQLASLMYFLKLNKINKFDLIYSEPSQYKKKESTKFSGGDIEVKQISGYEGNHTQNITNDILIVGSGYDYHLIKSVCNSKAHAKKSQVIGFPSLLPDMYQENLLQASRAVEEIGDFAFKRPILAPANDPFETAQALSEEVKKIKSQGSISNIYLSPLSTKPQTIGFILYYLTELSEEPASVIFPFCSEYSQETSVGINKIWSYTIEYDATE